MSSKPMHVLPKRVLIVKTSSLGDVIHTLPAITDATKAIPSIKFDWVVEESFSEIPSWHPAVDKIIPVAIRRWRKNIVQTWRSGEWANFRKDLKARKYDLVIDAQGLLKSALLTRGLDASVYGLDKDSAREPLAAKFYTNPVAVAKGQHAVERVRQLFAKALGYPCPEEKGHFQLAAEKFSDSEGLRPKEPYLVFVHGTTWVDKHWPDTYWCQLAKKATEAGYIVCLPWGNDKEHERAKLIANGNPNVQVLPKMPLKGVASIIAGAEKVVAVDTGLGHLTAALEIPAVSLYGPTSPVLVGAYGEQQKHLTLDDCDKTGSIPDVHPAIFAPMTPELVWEQLEAGV
ncbi:lipopolysaccharide heptosyltransferase I [Sansalvadorimonas sp. 2012CJ34-2]|uniref:Lipopolysaccharide heptosyltransferase 1 n=1 Tax=Parendozoicomonas callyspongiae TaxID=2942213 RepID=A0ABT0PAR0_9GAMM|nr:lipopolysaccharide heptosyltransferase I [Sansalvadorimonas sp. 2012CJ34-2]MCL6268358.1 lipopolysaccharide heptosyltransferase I [Sansalvadorimonas sp. 2012CJ34-2]